MKVYLSPTALKRLEDPIGASFMKAAVEEAMRHGLDTVKHENNPFYQKCRTTLWWDRSCPLAVFHDRSGDFAIVFENPHHPHPPPRAGGYGGDYFKDLLPYCSEMAIA